MTATTTAQVKAEVVRCAPPRLCCRRAQVATLVRFAGVVRPAGHQLALEVVVDDRPAGERLAHELLTVFGHPADVSATDRLGTGPHTVRVVGNIGALARQTGLVDATGTRVRGLPVPVVSGGRCDADAAWRAAFLAAGTLEQAGTLTVTCPTSETALALVGAARRLALPARSRIRRDQHLVEVRDTTATVGLLRSWGADRGLRRWVAQQRAAEAASHAAPGSFRDANQQRTQHAAARMADRAAAALELLGDDVSEHLRTAALSRMAHPQLSLSDLAKLQDPPVSKDALAGRLRRLLELAAARGPQPPAEPPAQ